LTAFLSSSLASMSSTAQPGLSSSHCVGYRRPSGAYIGVYMRRLSVKQSKYIYIMTHHNPFYGTRYKTYYFAASIVHTEAPNRAQRWRRLIFLAMRLGFAWLHLEKPMIVGWGVDEAMVNVPLRCVAFRNGIFYLFNWPAKATVEEGTIRCLSDAMDRRKAKQTRVSSWRLISGREMRGVFRSIFGHNARSSGGC
jgi:hypothetical protein